MNSTYFQTYLVKIERDLKTGQAISEFWRDKRGRLHRNNDLPAVIYYDLETGKTIQSEYFFHGRRHRVTGPAYFLTDPVSDIVYYEQWEQYGQLARYNDTAVVIKRDRSTGIVTQIERIEEPLQDRSKSEMPKPI